MSFTLTEMKVGMSDKVAEQVVDIFLRESEILQASFTNPSSKLVKENVVDMSEEEAKKILQLKPVDFDYIEAYGGEKNQHGLIAEDTLGIIPSCVTVPEGYSEKEFDAEKGIRNKVLAIDYSKLVPYLIKMVQIQQEEIEKLKEAMNKEGVSND